MSPRRITAHLVLILPLLCVTTLSVADSEGDNTQGWPKVVGGTTSTDNAFPWLVALVQPVDLGGAAIGCGSSLIDPQWLLTAAHCFYDPNTGALVETTATVEALLGTNDTTTGGIRIPITEIIIHENYDNNHPDLPNDIALMRLAQSATQITVPLVTPATENMASPGTTATVAGWGATDPNDIDNSLSVTTLLQVDLAVSTDAVCDGVSNNNSPTQLCAGGVADQDACPGDSGGPLVVPNGDEHFALAGVVSRGAAGAPRQCGDVDFPGIYTRVSRYNDWILPKIAGGTATGLISSVLPTSRSVKVGQAATAFATIINTGSEQATGCRILGPAGLGDATFTFNTTDAFNVPNGTANAPFNIDGNNGSQSLVFAFTRTMPLGSTQLQLGFDCDNTVPADTITGLTTLLFSASATATPDIITLPATSGSIAGVVDISGATGTTAFAVATANVGSDGDITVSASTGQNTLPLTLTVCETTNAPVLGQCLAPPAASVTTTITANATPTFSIYAQGSGQIATDFVTNRIFVNFADSGGTVRGGTSVAVRTVQ